MRFHAGQAAGRRGRWQARGGGADNCKRAAARPVETARTIPSAFARQTCFHAPVMDAPQIYLICLGVGLLFTIVSAVAGHAFGGHGDLGHDVGGHAQGHAEGGGGAGDMPGFAPLSPVTIATFVTAFGGFGMVFSSFEATRSAWISAPLAALGALAVAAGVFWLFNLIFQKTQGSSEGRVADLVGQAATVITPIAADGVGEIAYVQGGSRYSAPARSEGGAALAGGATVKITRIVGTQFYVAAA
jgi:membrane protein implicated in regulation of membrane protease activity